MGEGRNLKARSGTEAQSSEGPPRFSPSAERPARTEARGIVAWPKVLSRTPVAELCP